MNLKDIASKLDGLAGTLGGEASTVVLIAAAACRETHETRNRSNYAAVKSAKDETDRRLKAYAASALLDARHSDVASYRVAVLPDGVGGAS